MKLWAALGLVLSLFALRAAAQPDPDSADLEGVQQIKSSVAKTKQLDELAKSAKPEQRTQLEAQRTKEVEHIVQAGETRPKSPVVNLEAGKALADVNEPRRAAPFVEKAVELAPKSPEARVARGNVRFALGDYKAAAQDAKTALDLDPKNGAARALLRFSESRLADLAAKVKMPAKPGFAQGPGETAGPGEPTPGLSARESGPGEPSASPIREADAAAALRVKADEALREGHAKLRLGEPSAAARLGRKAADLAPKDAEVLAQASFLRLRGGDVPGALNAALTAAARKPRLADAFLLQAAAYSAAGDKTLAAAALQRAAELSPRYARLAARTRKLGPARLAAEVADELSARFTPGYESALARLGHGEPAARASGPAPARGSGSSAASRRLTAIATGALLLSAGCLLALRRFR